MMNLHKKSEKNVVVLILFTLIVVAIGGLVEIVPLFYLKNTIEPVQGMRPYTPLELSGRDIYVREGCYLCHSQMIRPFRDEVERYGHYSLAAESMYDHPFQWGSKRTGPDLARVGGRYSNDWHTLHLKHPQTLVPESVMPSYPFLFTRVLNDHGIADKMKALRLTGVPYTDEMIENARADLAVQALPDADAAALSTRYPKVNTGDFDGNPKEITEGDALIAYLQMLGTLVDFNAYQKPEGR